MPAYLSRVVSRRSPLRNSQQASESDRVLTFREWCDLNGISARTGRRILAGNDGPKVLQISERRIGIRESDNARWQESRLR
jgi:predicted DNA-binding transcriptional regulator AlpA